MDFHFKTIVRTVIMMSFLGHVISNWVEIVKQERKEFVKIDNYQIYRSNLMKVRSILSSKKNYSGHSLY